jgi:hypothetical protein
MAMVVLVLWILNSIDKILSVCSMLPWHHAHFPHLPMLSGIGLSKEKQRKYDAVFEISLRKRGL